jgi:hypothetical protein
VARVGVHDNAVREPAIGYDRLSLGSVRVHDVNLAGIQLEYEETGDDSFRNSVLRFHASFLYAA